MIFGLLAAICLVVAAVLLVRLHTLFTGLSPVSGAVDDLGTKRYHPYYRAMVVALGLAAFILAVGLARETDAVAVAWLEIYGGTRVVIAGVMTDPRRALAGGRVHLVLVLMGFAAIALAAILLHWDGDPSILRPLGILVALCALAAAVTRVLPAVRERFGAAERALYLTSISWLGVVAVDLVVA
ncbi:MAG: DUF998 domain-containing protein [Thermoleophilaceae bacterium]